MFNDSKTFVDLPLVVSPDEATARFADLLRLEGPDLTVAQLRHFLDEYFGPDPNAGLVSWTPPDWTEDIPLIHQIRDPGYLDMAKAVHAKWADLGRRTTSGGELEEGRSSLVNLPQGFIVPGGRFREMYYWDTYWTILGLLVSRMHQTVKGMLYNFAHLIQTYGMVPNGNRIYYTTRSQPPLFIPMVWAYFQVLTFN